MNLSKIMQAAGFTAALVGTAGMPGAIHFWTGYLTAGTLMIGGALAMYCFRTEKGGKKMSELEIQELQSRAGAMTEEEQQIVVELLPDELLIKELTRRYGQLRCQVEVIQTI